MKTDEQCCVLTNIDNNHIGDTVVDCVGVGDHLELNNSTLSVNYSTKTITTTTSTTTSNLSTNNTFRCKTQFDSVDNDGQRIRRSSSVLCINSDDSTDSNSSTSSTLSLFDEHDVNSYSDSNVNDSERKKNITVLLPFNHQVCLFVFLPV